MTQTPIYGLLDPIVAPLVVALREAGFDTLHSCDGRQEGSAFRLPWVIVAETCPGFIDKLLDWLDDHEIAGTVSREWSTVEGERHQQIRIVVYSDLCSARLGGGASVPPERILALRQRLGWRQDDLAFTLHCSRALVAAWEAGERHVSPLHMAHLEALMRRHLPEVAE